MVARDLEQTTFAEVLDRQLAINQKKLTRREAK